MLNIGCHLSSSNGFLSMAYASFSIGGNTFQFFTRNPRGGQAKEIDEKDVEEFLKVAKGILINREGNYELIGRSFDVDDIILNVVGGIIGFLLYISLNAIRTHLPKFLRKDWFLNLLSILVIVLIILYFLRII